MNTLFVLGYLIPLIISVVVFFAIQFDGWNKANFIDHLYLILCLVPVVNIFTMGTAIAFIRVEIKERQQ